MIQQFVEPPLAAVTLRSCFLSDFQSFKLLRRMFCSLSFIWLVQLTEVCRHLLLYSSLKFAQQHFCLFEVFNWAIDAPFSFLFNSVIDFILCCFVSQFSLGFSCQSRIL
ncbi:hypothetical protein XENORESO_013415 [Xenotaenia resolanae]|uniref:Uncharacterized protein n=1 Tax=Xenotaenia resolanae TaxID=208358 RepID=A0ABV0WMX2_9TELE